MAISGGNVLDEELAFLHSIPDPACIARSGEIVAANAEMRQQPFFDDDSEELIENFNILSDSLDSVDELVQHLHDLDGDNADETFIGKIKANGERRYQISIGDIITTGRPLIFRQLTPNKSEEKLITSLNDATKGFIDAQTTEDIAAIAAKAASNVLGFPGTGFRVYDPTDEKLVHIQFGSKAGEIDERPDFDVEDSPHGEAFLTGETIIQDVSNPDPYGREVFTQVMYVPVGMYGVLSVGKEETAFTDVEQHLAELIAENARVSFERLKQSGELLQRKRRMDKVAKIVTHDLRNMLTIAKGYLENHPESNTEPLSRSHSALQRMEDVLNDLGLLTKRNINVEERWDPVSLGRVVDNAVANAEVPSERIRVQNGGVAIKADSLLLQRVIEVLLRLAWEHCNSRPELTVNIVGLDHGGFAIATNTPLLPANEDIADVFKYGHGTTTKGLGFEMATVGWIAEFHGWKIEIDEESRDRIEFVPEESPIPQY